MRLILIIILGIIALSIVGTLIGPLIVLGIGAALIYYAYKNLVRPNNGMLSIIWWVVVGAIGVKMFIGALPGFVFIAAIAALVYIAYKRSNRPQASVNADSNGSSMYSEYENFEAEWRDITRR